MLPISDNGIFWNVYEQECRFRGASKKPPGYVRTTCDKLAALYPDLDDAEMFMRAQFVTHIEDLPYHLKDLVFGFKDFIMDRHHQAYRDYKDNQLALVNLMLDVAYRRIEDIEQQNNMFDQLLQESNITLSDWQSRGWEALDHLSEELKLDICSLSRKPSTPPLIKYLMEKEDSPGDVIGEVAVECLHYPLLMKSIPLTDDLVERVQFYKDEVRGVKEHRRLSGNPRDRPVNRSHV
jgi:hypothetical protein